MAEVLLLHHVQGRTDGMEALADRLRAAGHPVALPDLFEGRTFSTIDEGMEYARGVGFATLLDRGVATAAEHGPGLVLVGFSLGVMPAQRLAQTRSGVRAAVLVDGCLPVEEFGDAWPDGVPVQVHGMEGDPFFAEGGDLEAARELVASTDDAELFLYDGDQHLFADASLDGHDAAATDLLVERVLGLLAGLE